MTKEQSGYYHLMAPLVVALVLVIGAAGYAVWKHQKPATPAAVTTQNSSSRTPAGSASSTSGSGATSTTDLNADVSGADSAVSQENTDAASANSALNDSQNQISVPTY